MEEIIPIKIGGCLLTNKDGMYEINKKAVFDYANTISNNWDLFNKKVVLILGGGSFGNVAPTQYKINNLSINTELKNVCQMTLHMFKYVEIVIDIFSKFDIPCYPFQSSSFITTKDGLPYTSFCESIQKCLSLGIMPILTGDLVFDCDKDINILSSDFIPEVLSQHFLIDKCIYISNVNGILFNRDDNSSLIKDITEVNYKDVMNVVGDSNQTDITGGMKTKLNATLRLAKKGYCSYLINGDNKKILLDVLKNNKVCGTRVHAMKEG